MILPRTLRNGDRIAIVAPAGKLPINGLAEAVRVLTSWGLNVILAKHVYDTDNYFAGNDDDRLTDLQQALDDPSIMAVLCGRGGYGVTRILDKIELESFKKSPKWVIGFSDITALHLKLEHQGIASIHGPMGTSFTNGSNQATINSLRGLLFEGFSKMVSKEGVINSGSVTAAITGGNLSLIIDSLGTTAEIDTRNKILFVEEIGEKTYKIDRMFQQLLRAGKLDKLAGLVIGHFSEIDDGNAPFGESWQEVIKNIVEPYSYPFSFGFSIGHEPENMPLVMGGLYQLNVDSEGATLEWQNHA